MNKTLLRGHIAAIFTIIIWATTYVSTKVLLEELRPMDILIFRTVIAYLALTLLSPRPLRTGSKRRELNFALAGLSGVTVYFLLQNIGLDYTTASNASIILSTASFFTAILGVLILKDKTPVRPAFFIGFVLSMAGITMISLAGRSAELHLGGDLLTLCSAIVWGLYSLLSAGLSTYGYTNLQVTRRIFFWGLIFLLPIMAASAPSINYAALIKPVNLLNLLFLGLFASALCFLTWNYAVKTIGAVGTSVYIYFEPVVTVISSAVILGEKITAPIVIGIVLTMGGLVISGRKKRALK